MMRNRLWVVFALVLAWHAAIFIFTQQPVPANDAFFYDGAVIHHLLHGGYYNPCVAPGFPISGTEVFSAYPPLYQLPLLGWMSIFGVSALSAIAFHLCLFGLYALVMFAVFYRLRTPPWCVNTAAVLLLGITFRDRPDSFAHVLGMLAVYACVRSRKTLGRLPAEQAGVWVWLMAAFVVLAITTSLQIGGIYLLVVSLATAMACHLDGEKLPIFPMSLMALIPMALVLVVRLLLPRAWAGFMENVHQTPFLTGFRVPHWQEIAKVVRSVPGILVVVILLPVVWFKRQRERDSEVARKHEVILLAALLPALGILVASLTIISANTVAISNYLQPLILAVYLAFSVSLWPGARWLRLQMALLIPAMLLVSVRIVGMTTWGVMCARDFGYTQAVQRTEAELANHPAGYKVVMSSAFLYTAAPDQDLGLIHSDWMTRAGSDSRLSDLRGLRTLKPEKMILTQFDYYRRFEAVLQSLRGDPWLKGIQVTNTARVRPPDSFKSLRQVVQHISWAPVIVDLSWRDGD